MPSAWSASLQTTLAGSPAFLAFQVANLLRREARSEERVDPVDGGLRLDVAFVGTDRPDDVALPRKS
jgi:hypothetical protein